MPSLTLGSCFIPASIAVLHASLSSAFFSLRQIVISSALGMNALQSLSTSGVHAMRCSGVPCEKEGAGEAVADSKASDTRHCAKGIGRSIQLFWLSMFIRGLHAQSKSILDIVIRADTNTLLPEFALVAKCQPLELSTPDAVLPLPFGLDMRGCSVRSVAPSASGAHKPPSHRTSIQALGTAPTLTFHVEMTHGRYTIGSGDEEMLKGFTAPRSPQGTAALVPSPPWHFAGDVLAVEFWNDPDVSVYTLPTGVELDKKCPGHSVALFTDYQFTAQNNEYLDPARYQSRGFIVLLDAMWKGSRIAWCPYCYADNDAALMRGWIQGYPRKFGAVHQTRTFRRRERGFGATRA